MSNTIRAIELSMSNTTRDDIEQPAEQPYTPPAFEPGKIVTEEDVHSALNYLRNSAHSLGQVTRREKHAEHMLKVQEGFGFMGADGSGEYRKAKSRTSEKYLQAVNEHAEAYGEARKIYALRDAASAVIDAWRTQEASTRKATKL